MKPAEIGALRAVGQVLSLESQRQHEINVAAAGRSETVIHPSPPVQHQIVLHDNTGRQATLVLDPQGNVYVVLNGVIHRISQNIVEEAEKEFVPKNPIENEFLPPYNLEEIERGFQFEGPRRKAVGPQIYEVTAREGEYMSEIASKLHVTVNDLKLKYWHGNESAALIEKLNKDLVKAKLGTKFEYRVGIELRTQVAFVFTCKWARDFDENGYDFEDFQGIKNSFSGEEGITFVMGYQTEETDLSFTLDIFEFNTGELVYHRDGMALPGVRLIMEETTTQDLNPGSYIFSYKLKKPEQTIDSKKERFEIRNE